MANYDFITRQYRDLLGHGPDPEGLQYWGGRLGSGDLAKEDFSSALLGAVTPENINLWETGQVQEVSPTDTTWGDTTLNTPSFITQQYRDLLGHGPDIGGLQYWSNLLGTGDITREDFPQHLLGAVTPENIQAWETGQVKEFNPIPELFNVEDLVGAGTYNRSFQGLDPNSPFVQALLPMLTQQAQALPEQAQQFTGSLQDFFSNLMRQSLGPQAFQGTLNQLASRNILESSITADALAKAQAGIATDIGQRGFESQLAGLQQQMDVPGQLAQLLGLGQIGKTEDPLGPYRLMAQFLA